MAGCGYGVFLTRTVQSAFIIYWITIFGYTLSASFALPFTLELTSFRGSRISLYIAFFTTLAPFTALLFGYGALPLIPGANNYYIPAVPTVLGLLMIPSFAMNLAASVILVIKMVSSSTVLERNKYVYFFAAFLLNMLAALLNGLIILFFPADVPLQITSAFLLVHIIVVLFFTTVDNIITSLLKWATYLVTVFSVYFLVMILILRILKKEVNSENMVPSLLTFLIVVAVYSLIRKILKQPLQIFPFQKSSPQSKTLSAFSEKAIHHHSRNKGLELILHTACELLNSERSCILTVSFADKESGTLSIFNKASSSMTTIDIALSGEDFNILTQVKYKAWIEQEDNPYIYGLFRRIAPEILNRRSYLISPVTYRSGTIDLLIISTHLYRRPVTESNLLELETLTNLAAALLERISNSENLVKSSREKEILIREIHHRVKNNLQIINSLLNLQIHSTDLQAVKIALSDSRNRVYSMASVHNQLYNSSSFSSISIRSYAQDLLRHLEQEFSNGAPHPRCTLECEDIQISVESAITLGLILNELITESIKKSIPPENENLEITITVTLTQKGEVHMTIHDNGFVGQLLEPEESVFGPEMIQMLVESKLQGTWENNWQSEPRYTIRFPLQEG